MQIALVQGDQLKILPSGIFFLPFVMILSLVYTLSLSAGLLIIVYAYMMLQNVTKQVCSHLYVLSIHDCPGEQHKLNYNLIL